MAKHVDTVPVEVYILTLDHDIKGVVYVSKYTNTNRELTDLLNDKDRRFLAVCDAEIVNRKTGGPPKKYNFLEVHMDYVLLVHPSAQVLVKETSRSQEDIARFNELRSKIKHTRPF